MSSEQFEAVINAKVQPGQTDIVAALRKLMSELAPQFPETVSHGSAVWKRGKTMLAILSPAKTHITFALSRGAELTDKFGLLEGDGKTVRHVKIKKLEDMNEKAVRDYIGQALQLEAL